MVMSNPLLARYYGSIRQIEGYWSGRMYDDIETRLGKDVWEQWDEYWDQKDESNALGRAYYNAHPDLAAYGDIKDEWAPIIADNMLRFGRLVVDRPIETREGEPLETAERGLPQLSAEEWQGVLGTSLMRLVLDAYGGAALPSSARTRLLNKAEEFGLPDNPYLLIQLAGQAMSEAP
jgi:hypothetical protein